MINIKLDNLNPLEKQIYNTLMDYSKENPKFRILKAADLCDCSVSKISKFVKKLGFTNFKQYLEFLYGEEISKPNTSKELERLSQFIKHFNNDLKNEFIDLIQASDKIIFFGYGPSMLCGQYFEYRLRTCSNKTVVALSDEISVSSMADKNTLLIILTVTGSFHSFENVYNEAKAKGAQVAIVAEEYNTSLFDQCDRIFLLSQSPQPSHLKAYEKSRTMFFIFLEEVIQQIQNNKEKNI